MAEKTDLSDSDEDTSEEGDATVGDHDSTPSPRFWHFSQLVEGNVYIGGGNIPTYKKKKGRARLTTTIEKLDMNERIWQKLETTGAHHPGLTGVACASFGKYLFAYGGNHAVEGLNGVLSQLDLDTLTWSELSPETKDGPLRKDASGMVHFGEDSLAVVCGYATRRITPNSPNKDYLTKDNGGSSDVGSNFIIREGPSAEGDGWTNEMHVFNRKFKEDHPGAWTVPSFSGPRPPPCADFSLTSIDLNKAILYGGRRGTDQDSNDLYFIDFSEKVITKIQPKNKTDKWPNMRLGHHAACCLGFNTENPQLLISGGRIKHQLPPKDIWILNLAAATWKEVKLPSDDIQKQLGRWGHTFTAITHSEGLVEVIMFGGSPGYYGVTWDVYKREDFGRLSFPVSFIFGFLDKEWEFLDIMDCSSHWTNKAAKFDLGSQLTLDVLYSMEQDKVPVLTVLKNNQRARQSITVYTENAEDLYKWPTLTKPSSYKPTWENLCLILQLVNMNDLIKKIKHYFKKKNGSNGTSSDVTIKGFKATTTEYSVLSSTEIQKLKKENKELKDRLETLQCQIMPSRKAELTTHVTPSVEDFELPGVDVCGETTFVITNNADVYKWDEYGLELCVCEDALPKGTDKCIINIKASIAGQYQFPVELSPVSAVFWLRCEPMCKFSKAITIKIEHCAKSENSPTKMSFVRTFCTKKKVPYIFEKISGGHFNKADGTIDLKGFSGVAVAGENPNREYCAKIFYLSQSKITIYKIDFVVTWNTKAHLEAVNEEYKKKDAEQDFERAFFFESDNIIIDIPLKGINVEGGWKIVPLTNTVLMKQIVDNYEEGKIIPKCRFSAKAMIQDGEEVPPLQHQATLLGAIPDNIITFDITPPPVFSGPNHSSKKRPASESDAAPAAKRIQIRKSKSLNLSQITTEDTSMQNCNRQDPNPSTTSTYWLSDVDSSVVLGVEDLVDVMNEVVSRKASYYALGRALRIEAGELDTVRKQYQSTDFDMALNEVLLLWLRQKYNTERFGRPTWRMLVEAIENRAGINDHALAQEIAQRHRHSNTVP